MEVLYPRCAGLDVHKDTVVAGLRLAAAAQCRPRFAPSTPPRPGCWRCRMLACRAGCTHVAMEATGVYWKPVWHVLSDGDVDADPGQRGARQERARPQDRRGRRAWLADLLAHGLIRASFVPEAATQEMRALLRTRKQLVREQASHIQRVQKTLEDANLKLASVLSRDHGRERSRHLQALIDGETDPDRLLALDPTRREGAGGTAPRGAAGAGHRCTIASCCACICARSMPWPRPWPRSTRRWSATSTLSDRGTPAAADHPRRQ